MTDRVQYRVEGRAGEQGWQLEVEISRPPQKTGRSLPVWTELEPHRCAGCSAQGSHCPAAVDLVPVIEAFQGLASFDRADVSVQTDEREYRKRSTTMQELARSIVGLVMSTSACPILSTLKPLARFHLPFSTFEETLFRAVSLHLVRGLFHERATPVDELDELRSLYGRICGLNRDFARRLRQIASGDAHLNGVVQLFTLGLLVGDELDAPRMDTLRSLVVEAEASP